MFPQVNCGQDDPRACFAREVFLEEFFLHSDTNMVTLSALPIAPKGSPLSAAIMEETRHTAELALRLGLWCCSTPRRCPTTGPWRANLDEMEENARTLPNCRLEGVHALPRRLRRSGERLAPRRRRSDPAAVGHAFIDKARQLGVKTICAHKGFGAGSRYASPEDMPGAARDFPDVNFVVYHSGFEAGGPPRVRTRRPRRNQGVNRLITAMKKHGVGPSENVYAELGSTWWTLMRDPTQAAHVLGKLLRYVGQDNVLWGTDCIWYGSPQDQIQTFRSFEISSEFQERYGYPELTRELKAKILGRNGARVYGIEPTRRSASSPAATWSRSGARSAPSMPPTGRGTPPRSSGFAPTTRGGRAESAASPLSDQRSQQHQPLIPGNAGRPVAPGANWREMLATVSTRTGREGRTKSH